MTPTDQARLTELRALYADVQRQIDDRTTAKSMLRRLQQRQSSIGGQLNALETKLGQPLTPTHAALDAPKARLDDVRRLCRLTIKGRPWQLINYRRSVDANNRELEQWGMCESDGRRMRSMPVIGVCDACPQEDRIETLVHEFVHAWFDEKLSEEEVEQFTNELTDAMAKFVHYDTLDRTQQAQQTAGDKGGAA